jgi:prolyl 4-hydroxylase
MISRAVASNMARAHVSGPGEGYVSDARTNDVSWIDHYSDPVFTRVGQRIAGLVGMPLSHAESFQVIHYGVGAEYKGHFDAFDPTTETGSRNWARGGQRLITALGYLNDVEAGGETGFSKLDTKVAPEVGKLLVFHNCEPGTLRRHPLSLHAGCPVEAGEKWAFNLWFRARSRREDSYPPTQSELDEYQRGAK